MGIKDQHDPRADEATKALYKKEFHAGVLKQNCGPYAGKTVREVKDPLIRDFRERGAADSMYDLPQSVVCRCMTPCIVKILSDQWFLNYSDPAWKEKAKEAVAQMKVYPETATQWFIAVIDWLKEWACARTTGFGTPLPWGKGWIIETLSDSTIYMAFYTINKHIRQHGIKPEALTHEVFDYIFYGKGNEAPLSKASGIAAEILREMREEFLYWYPFDLRVSAKELVPNHLTFCIFHHAALFPREQWPRAIGVNGMLMIEGKQMHKSKGNFVTMKNAVEQYGADATRCALLLGAEGMDDPDWRGENAADIQGKLESLRNLALSIVETAKRNEMTHLERWLLSRLQQRIAEVTGNLEELKTRTALEIALFETWNDFRWYTRRKGKTEAKAVQEALEVWLRLLAPFAPYLCEELWSATGKNTFISLADWPRADEDKVDVLAEEQENLITGLIEDTLNVLKATKISPTRICYYTAAGWKWRVYRNLVAKAVEGEVKVNEVMKELAKDPSLRENMKAVASFVAKVLKALSKLPNERKTRIAKIELTNEKEIIEDALGFLKERFNAEVTVYGEEDKARYDPKQRAALAMPGQPAIYIE
jgi:leucyl-tRNA synthetase